MCGIVGHIGCNNSKILEAMLSSIKHRGPDNPDSILTYESCCFGCARLSIVDIPHGDQPYYDVSNQHIILFNGEIYNHLQLRNDLKNKEYFFSTQSEVELISKLFQEYGDLFVSYLDGMFAIAIYDIGTKTLLLYRDQIGIKPLYFVIKNSQFYFSSEFKSFTKSKVSDCKIDESYLVYKYVFDFSQIEKTIFLDIKSLQPGSYLKYGLGKITIKRYADITEQRKGLALNPRNVRELLVSSVKNQLPNDIPFAILLSGGIDSSILAYISCKLLKANPVLFTISDKSKTDDLQAAGEFSKFLNIPLSIALISKNDFVSNLAKYLFHVEDYNMTSYFWFLLSKALKASMPQLKVALCGQGADEIFCGYPFHRHLSETISTYQNRYENLKKISSNPEIVSDVSIKIKELSLSNQEMVFHRFFLQEQLVSYQLNILDKAGMSQGIEYRVPYLNQNLVCTALSTGISYVKSHYIEKKILREAFKDDGMPNLFRPKTFSGISTLPMLHDMLNQIIPININRNKFKYWNYRSYFKANTEFIFFELLMVTLTSDFDLESFNLIDYLRSNIIS